MIKNDRHNIGLPNLLTLSRLLFVPFIILFLSWRSSRGDILAVLFMLLCGLTDFFDGYLARHMDQRSHLGRMLDPLVDKISVGATMLALAAYKELPYWYVSLVIGRDLLILISGLYAVSKKQIIFESNTLGKWTLGSFMAVIITYTAGLGILNRVVMFISVIMIPASTIKYLGRYRELGLRTIENVLGREGK